MIGGGSFELLLQASSGEEDEKKKKIRRAFFPAPVTLSESVLSQMASTSICPLAYVATVAQKRTGWEEELSNLLSVEQAGQTAQIRKSAAQASGCPLFKVPISHPFSLK